MKPIGYYVSVPEGHEDYKELKKLEDVYGSYFENMPTRNLWAWLVLCVRYTENPQAVIHSNVPISSSTAFELIPFLHQVIKERNNGD